MLRGMKSPPRDTTATTEPDAGRPRGRPSGRSPGRPPGRTGAFGRLAAWSQSHRWGALLLWILVVAAITVGSQAAGSAYRNDFALPGTDSQTATDLLTEHGSRQAGDSVQIVFKDDGGLRAERGSIEKTLDRVRGLPSVTEVRGPYADASALSRDGTVGYATVTLDGKAEEVPKRDITRIIDTAEAAEGQGLEVALGGEAVRGAEEEAGGAAEGAGMLAALVNPLSSYRCSAR